MENNVLSSSLIDNILNEVYLINKGVRTCALLEGTSFSSDTEEESVYQIEQLILKNGLNYFWVKHEKSEDYADNVYYTVYIYKYEHQRYILSYLENKMRDQNPLIYEWMMGKCLGYSDEAMEQFLTHIVIDKMVEFAEKKKGGEENVLKPEQTDKM